MKRLLLTVGFAFAGALTTAPCQTTGTVVIYGVGDRVTLPIIVDTQVKVKLGNGKKIEIHLSAGEHQVESKLGALDAVLAINVQAGETTYILREYKRIGIGSLLMMKDPREHMSLTFEHTNASPEGEFKEEEVKQDLAAWVSRLPPYHEVASVVAPAEIQFLSDDEVKDAVLQGRHTKDAKTLGVLLDDYQQQFGSALVQGQSVSGYSIRLYSAKQWIELQAAIANHEMRPFTEDDVEPKLRRKLLYVLATPSTPDSLTGKNMAAASNVQRIVLENGPSKAVVQPITLDPSQVNVDSALRSASYVGMMATFPQPDMLKPFSVVVIGDSYTKTFTVKEKNLSRLK